MPFKGRPPQPDRTHRCRPIWPLDCRAEASSLLSQLLAPAAIASGLIATSTASGRSATTDFVGLDGWLNTSVPLTIPRLRGKVVLVEFGTYTCINWRRTLPYVNRWHREYGHGGLQVILVHTPEFSCERIHPNIETILPGLGVTYPVALDSDYQTWRAWQNRAWPALYMLDRDGRVRLVRRRGPLGGDRG